MKLIIVSLLLTIIIALCSCATMSISDLQQVKSNVIEFTVNQDYQSVYRTIIESELMPMHEAKWALYPNLESASIWFQVAVSPFGKFVLIEIARISDQNTKVRYLYQFEAWRSRGLEILSLFPEAKLLSTPLAQKLGIFYIPYRNKKLEVQTCFA